MGGKFRALVVNGKVWSKKTGNSDPQTLVNLLQPQCFTLVYVHKDEKNPTKWAVVALFDSTSDDCKKVIDDVAKKLGYTEGILDPRFVRKYIKDNPLVRLARSF
jgi:hypothetical protein